MFRHLSPLSLEKSRVLFRISGQDAPKFLKRMTTRNVETHPLHSPFLSLVLNSSGKILMDLIMWKENDYSIVCEVDALLGSRFQKHLTKYALRQDLRIESLKDWKVFVLPLEGGVSPLPDTSALDLDANPSSLFVANEYLGSPEDASFIRELYSSIENHGEKIVFQDPRSPLLGSRVWTTDSPLTPALQSARISPVESELKYNTNKALLGIPEGYYDLLWEKSVPWESNYDIYSAVDLGFCFMGQELTARSFHTGVFRKRMLPLVAIDENNNLLDFGQQLQDGGKGEKEPKKPLLPKHGELIRAEGVSGRHGRIGRMGSSTGALGLGVVKTREAMEGMIFYGEESNTRFKALIPHWLPQAEKERANREMP